MAYLSSRAHPRVRVGPQYMVQFRIRSRELKRVRVMELSAAGCKLWVPSEQLLWFTEGMILDDFSFHHPDLQFLPIQAEVVYLPAGGNNSAPPGSFHVGLRFVNLALYSRRLLADHVEALIKRGGAA